MRRPGSRRLSQSCYKVRNFAKLTAAQSRSLSPDGARASPRNRAGLRVYRLRAAAMSENDPRLDDDPFADDEQNARRRRFVRRRRAVKPRVSLTRARGHHALRTKPTRTRRGIAKCPHTRT